MGWGNPSLSGRAEDGTLGTESKRLGLWRSGGGSRPGEWRGRGGGAQRTRVGLGVREGGVVKSRAWGMGGFRVELEGSRSPIREGGP